MTAPAAPAHNDNSPPVRLRATVLRNPNGLWDVKLTAPGAYRTIFGLPTQGSALIWLHRAIKSLDREVAEEDFFLRDDEVPMVP